MNEQDQNAKSATQVLDNVKSMMLSNPGYTPTSIDFLVLSGIMEIARFSVAVIIAPIINVFAVVAAYFAIVAAWKNKQKKILWVAIVFGVIDVITLITVKGYIQEQSY